MSRRLSELAKVAGISGQPTTEMPLPKPVHQHAARQRVIRPRDPVGQGGSATGRLQRGRRWRDIRQARGRECSKNPARREHRLFGIRVAGANGPASLTTNFTCGNGFGSSGSNAANSARSCSHLAFAPPSICSGSFSGSKPNCRSDIVAICCSYAVRCPGRLRIMVLILVMNLSNPSPVACFNNTGCSIAWSWPRTSSVAAAQALCFFKKIFALCDGADRHRVARQ